MLEFLLSIDLPGVEVLRRQADVASVSAVWRCCPTVELAIESAEAEAFDPPRELFVVQARPRDAERGYEVLLFVRNGWLELLELVHHLEQVPAEFPPTSELDLPEVEDPLDSA